MTGTTPSRSSSARARSSTASTSREGRAVNDVNRRVLPGFRLSLGYTLAYLGVLVLVPLVACFLKAATLPFDRFWAAVSTERAVAAYELTVGASLVSAAINVVVGLLVAWVLVRYEFPLKRVVDSLEIGRAHV